METKFTPGPWYVDIGNAQAREMTEVYSIPTQGERMQIGRLICEWQNAQQRNEDIANANLVSAAPELYAALANLLDKCTKPCDCSVRCAAENEASCALAKARGEKGE